MGVSGGARQPPHRPPRFIGPMRAEMIRVYLVRTRHAPARDIQENLLVGAFDCIILKKLLPTANNFLLPLLLREDELFYGDLHFQPANYFFRFSDQQVIITFLSPLG